MSLFKILMEESLEQAQALLYKLEESRIDVYGEVHHEESDENLAKLNLIILHTELLKNEIRDLKNLLNDKGFNLR